MLLLVWCFGAECRQRADIVMLQPDFIDPLVRVGGVFLFNELLLIPFQLQHFMLPLNTYALISIVKSLAWPEAPDTK